MQLKLPDTTGLLPELDQAMQAVLAQLHQHLTKQTVGAASTTTVPAASPAEASAVLRELRTCLDSMRGKTRTFFEANRTALAALVNADTLVSIERLIKDFEFDEAAELLKNSEG